MKLSGRAISTRRPRSDSVPAIAASRSRPLSRDSRLPVGREPNARTPRRRGSPSILPPRHLADLTAPGPRSPRETATVAKLNREREDGRDESGK